MTASFPLSRTKVRTELLRRLPKDLTRILPPPRRKFHPAGKILEVSHPACRRRSARRGGSREWGSCRALARRSSRSPQTTLLQGIAAPALPKRPWGIIRGLPGFRQHAASARLNDFPKLIYSGPPKGAAPSLPPAVFRGSAGSSPVQVQAGRRSRIPGRSPVPARDAPGVRRREQNHL